MSEQRKYTPPAWLRHITPWWMLHWIDNNFDTCWANMCTWKQFGSEVSWWPDERCFHPYDYCNKFPERGDDNG